MRSRSSKNYHLPLPCNDCRLPKHQRFISSRNKRDGGGKKLRNHSLQVARVKTPIPKVVLKSNPSVTGKNKCCNMNTVVIHNELPTSLTKLSRCLKIKATTNPVAAVTVTTREKAGIEARVDEASIGALRFERIAAIPEKSAPHRYKYVYNRSLIRLALVKEVGVERTRHT